MTEIPEHLLKRAQAARERAAKAGDEAEPAAESAAEAPTGERAPRRARSPPTCSSGPSPPATPQAGGGYRVVTAAAADGGASPRGAAPTPTGPGGHTQRLLTVVKSGSIQDVKLKPVDKVHVWPHLLIVEFVAALAVTAFTLIFSIFVNAPLLELANFNETPNPSKAPWYFLGLQELLTMFHPMVAGVTIPGIALFVLILAPYIDKQPQQVAREPQVRRLAHDDPPHVLGGPRHDRLVLPRARS